MSFARAGTMIGAYGGAGKALAEADWLPIAKPGEGLVEQLRSLMDARRSVMKARFAALRQIKSSLGTAPGDVRVKWERAKDGALVDKISAISPADVSSSVVAATNHALWRLAREVFHLITHPSRYLTADLRALRHERGATILEVAMRIGTDPARTSEPKRGKQANA